MDGADIRLGRPGTDGHGNERPGEIDIRSSSDFALGNKIIETRPVHDHNVCGLATPKLSPDRVRTVTLRGSIRCCDLDTRGFLELWEDLIIGRRKSAREDDLYLREGGAGKRNSRQHDENSCNEAPIQAFESCVLSHGVPP